MLVSSSAVGDKCLGGFGYISLKKIFITIAMMIRLIKKANMAYIKGKIMPTISQNGAIVCYTKPICLIKLIELIWQIKAIISSLLVHRYGLTTSDNYQCILVDN